MNCLRCNTPLAPNARFCRVCGLPVSTAPANAAPIYQPDAPVVPTPPWQVQQPPPVAPSSWQAPQLPPAGSPPWPVPHSPQPPRDMPSPLPQPGYYQPMAPIEPGTMRSGGPRAAQNLPDRPRRRGSCLLRGVAVLVVLALLLMGSWFFVARPYLNALVLSQMDQVLGDGISHVVPLPTILVPAGTQIPVNEQVINSLITLAETSSSPVQDAQLSIAPTGISLSFRIYGFVPCTATGVIGASRGQLVVSGVTVQGIAGLVVSPDDLTREVNKQLMNVQARLNRSVARVELQDHQLLLTLGS